MIVPETRDIILPESRDKILFEIRDTMNGYDPL